MKVLSAEDVRRRTPMPVAIEVVRQAFLDLAAGQFVLPARQIFGDGAVLVMSAYQSPTGTAVVKKIGGATRLALLGTGGQAADQVRAVIAVRRITHVAVTGRNLTRATALAADLGQEFPPQQAAPSSSPSA